MFLNPLHLARLAATAALLVMLTGCQAIVSSPSASQVRVVNASPDTPSVDVYQGNDAVAYNLGFGAITSYIPVTPGVLPISAATAGTRQVLSLAKPAFAPATQYTILIGNTVASLQQLILKDQNQPAPAGKFALRVIDEATRTGPVDLYLVPTGHLLTAVPPTLTGIHFGENTGYQEIPAGIYSLTALPAGTIPTSTTLPSYAGARINYPSTSAHTVILIDQPLPTTPGLQIIAADDYDAPSAN